MKRSVLAGLIVAAALGAGAVQAHHSFAMFDQSRTVTLKGTVHAFQWTNPHAWIEIDVPSAGGKVEKWGVELNSPNNLARQGWNRRLIKPGDKVTILVNPLRNGTKGGLFSSMTLPDGKVIKDPRAGSGPINVSARAALPGA